MCEVTLREKKITQRHTHNKNVLQVQEAQKAKRTFYAQRDQVTRDESCHSFLATAAPATPTAPTARAARATPRLFSR